MKSNNIDWKKMKGLVPAIIQDHRSLQVLMLGYMNQEAYAQTVSTQKVTFYSRSKQRLWVKGETSGNYLNVVDIILDCDRDTILIHADPLGPSCHLGNDSCFEGAQRKDEPFFDQLTKIIEQRRIARPKGSYITSLFNAGTHRMAQKVGEEGVEVALAAKDECQKQLIDESADLIFHLMILLQSRKLSLKDTENELCNRHHSDHQ